MARVSQSATEALTAWDRVFREHPQSLGETYWQHQRHALHFGSTMIVAGFACVIHAIIPALFLRAGSSAVVRLHRQMADLKRLPPITRNRVASEDLPI